MSYKSWQTISEGACFFFFLQSNYFLHPSHSIWPSDRTKEPLKIKSTDIPWVGASTLRDNRWTQGNTNYTRGDISTFFIENTASQRKSAPCTRTALLIRSYIKALQGSLIANPLLHLIWCHYNQAWGGERFFLWFIKTRARVLTWQVIVSWCHLRANLS